MAVTVATLKAVVTADITGLQSGLTTAQTNLKKTEQEAERLKKRLDEMASRLNAVGSALTIGITAPLVALGRASVEAAVKFDSLKRGLTAVAGGAKQAEEQLKRLKEIAKLPGLSFADAIQGSIRLQAAGFSALQAEKSLRVFGNALATVGKGAADLNGVSLALSQIMSKGKVMAEEINQIAERTPQIRKIMVQAFGTADTEILQKAKITSSEFVQIITNELDKLPKVTGGMQNAFENAQDSIAQSLERIGKAVVPVVAVILDKLVPAIEKITTWFSELPKEVQTASVVMLGFAAVGGPLVLLTSQIVQLGQAIGMARLAALGPVGGIAALIGAGSLAGLAAWNADSDRKIAAANTTAAQSFGAQLKSIDAQRADIQRQINRDGKNPDGSIPLHTATLMQQLETLNKQRDDLQRRFIMAASRENAQMLKEQAAVRAEAYKQQEAADKAAAAARAKIKAAEDEAARKKAEAEARRAAAEAERIRKLNADIEEDIKRMTTDRFSFERFQANQAYLEAVKRGADRVKAAERLNARLKEIEKEHTDSFMAEINKRGEAMRRYMEEQAEQQVRIDKAIRDRDFNLPERGGAGAAGDVVTGIPVPAEVAAGRERRQRRRGFDVESALPERRFDSIAGGINPGLLDSIRNLPDVIPSRQIMGPGEDAARRAAESRRKQTEEFMRDLTQSARRASRNFLKSLFGDSRDRQNVLKGFVSDLTDTLIDQISKVSFEKALLPALKGMTDKLGEGLAQAVTGVLKVAESSVGRMLGAVYNLLQSLNQKGGLNVGNFLGGAIGAILGGWPGAAFGMNVGGKAFNGDFGGVLTDSLIFGASGGFGSLSGGGAKAGGAIVSSAGAGANLATAGAGRSRSQVTQIINIANQNISREADERRVAAENARRLVNTVRSGVPL